MNNENDKFSLPTNIKQIGTIADGFRIYVEDYALTYINQFAKECGCEEKNAILLGEDCVIDGNKVLFISGVIQGKFSEAKNGMEILTDRSWQYINEAKEKYFPELKILGWVYIQPGYGDYVNDFHLNYHFNQFRGDNNVLLILDPIENISSFYIGNNEKRELQQLKGYIVYYDKNASMQDYMIENRVVKINIEEENPEGFRSTSFERPGSDNSKKESTRIQPRTNHIRGKLVAEQKKLVNLFGSLSAVLFLVCFIMGAGLVQNDDRIRKIENQLTDIDNSYQFLLNQVSANGSASVFAQNAEVNSQKAVTENSSQQTSEEIESKVSTTIKNEADKMQEDKNTQSENSEPSTAEKENDNKEEKNYQKYVVREGDTLGIICRRIYGNEDNMEKILAINNIENPDKIRIGDAIKLP